MLGGGAWPFLVGGVICLVNSVNERDLNLLNSYASLPVLLILGFAWVWGGNGSAFNFLEGLFVSSEWKFEAITGL